MKVNFKKRNKRSRIINQCLEFRAINCNNRKISFSSINFVLIQAFCSSPEPPYQIAAHYWPLNNFTKSKTLLDLRGHSTTLTYNKVRLSFADQLGHVISLDGEDDYILASGIRSKCIKDPTHCTRGLSVAFWINYTKGKTNFHLTVFKVVGFSHWPFLCFI